MNGNESSIVLVSLPNLLIILPIDVCSKKFNDVFITEQDRLSYNKRHDRREEKANKNDIEMKFLNSTLNN